MKRFFSLLLISTLVLTICPNIGIADTVRQSGDFFYKIKGNGTAVITAYDWDNHNNGDDIFIPRMLDGYTVTEIGNRAFFCLGEDEHGFPIPHNENQLYQSPYRVNSLVIPDTVRSIGTQAFMGIVFNTFSISIPASVEYIGYGAFGGLYGIKQFVVDSANPVYATIDGVLYNKQRKELLSFPYTYDFKNHSSGKTVSLPNGIVSIADYAFWGIDFNSLNVNYCCILPQTLQSIGNFAFAHCNQLDFVSGTSVFRLPDTVKALGIGAFYQSLFYGERLAPKDKIMDMSNTQISEIPDYAFCNLRYEVYSTYQDFSKLIFPETLQSIGVESFKGFRLDFVSNGVKGIEFPASLKSIGNSAFEHLVFYSYDDAGISFSTNSSLTSIGKAAFRDSDCCFAILPEKLDSIDSYAFEKCRYLTVLSIPENVTFIGQDVCSKSYTGLDVIPGTYGALWASENGYTTQQAGQEDTSWLN